MVGASQPFSGLPGCCPTGRWSRVCLEKAERELPGMAGWRDTNTWKELTLTLSKSL